MPVGCSCKRRPLGSAEQAFIAHIFPGSGATNTLRQAVVGSSASKRRNAIRRIEASNNNRWFTFVNRIRLPGHIGRSGSKKWSRFLYSVVQFEVWMGLLSI